MNNFETVIKEKIQDQLDYEVGFQALKRFKENPVTHAIDDVIKELEVEYHKERTRSR